MTVTVESYLVYSRSLRDSPKTLFDHKINTWTLYFSRVIDHVEFEYGHENCLRPQIFCQCWANVCFFKVFISVNHAFNSDAYERTSTIYVLDRTQFRQVGTLAFYVLGGSFGVVNNIMINYCFPSGEDKRCRRAFNPLGPYRNVTLSKQEHRGCLIAVSNRKYKNSHLSL